MNRLYHYTGCALPNVYLENGYELVKSPYGEGVTIHDIDGLHAALGAVVVADAAPLTGADFRFLRQELGLSQAALGDLVGKDEQAVARWEKGKSKKVDATADRLLRLLYKDATLGKKKFATMIEFLRKLESTPPAPKSFVAREVDSAWSATATAVTD
jgi:DNA-binding transcriptional regulator YiaG